MSDLRDEFKKRPALKPIDTLSTNLNFGDYVEIEQKRYSCENEFYLYKVIGTLRSNAFVQVPVDAAVNGTKEITGDCIFHVVNCVCVGVVENQVRKFKVSDVRKVGL